MMLLGGGCDRTPAEPGSTAGATQKVPTPPAPPPPSATAATDEVAPAAATAPEAAKAVPAPPDVAAPPADAKKTASGLALKVLTPGKGKERPGPEDKVTVHYTGWTTDGQMFDSSVARGEPATFRVSGVIKGWTEALQLMNKGEKARLWIPGKLAYGDAPSQPGMPAGTLVFDVELLDFTAAPKPPPVPPDVKAAPANAKKTDSGLAYRVLQKGKGTRHPTATDRVKVNYSGWTTDGKMFDSSVTRGEPASFPLNGVIKGWTEGLQLMVEGEKTRFWIPAELAYGSNPRPGAPSGMLVFDIELLAIE
jgi:peptidylprolyl isomerase